MEDTSLEKQPTAPPPRSINVVTDTDIKDWLDGVMKKGRVLEPREKAYFKGCNRKALLASGGVALLTVSSLFLLRKRISMVKKTQVFIHHIKYLLAC